MCSDFPAPTKQALGFSLDIPANRVSSYRAGRSGSGCQEESPTEGWEAHELRGLGRRPGTSRGMQIFGHSVCAAGVPFLIIFSVSE